MKRQLHHSDIHNPQHPKRQNQRENVYEGLEQTQGSWSRLDGESDISKLVHNAEVRLRSSPLGTGAVGILSADSLIESTSKRPLLSAKDQKETLSALDAIKTTPFEHSFLARLQGSRAAYSDKATIFIDWETITPWMQLMEDIRAHYYLFHDQDTHMSSTPETLAPITYMTLKREHLEQVHDLLQRVFWSGIDVTDSLDYSPEKATVIALYKKLVVGVAILSSPKETYITFLAVRAGWDKAQIAKTMLYLLVSRNPDSDITLHVSVNNSAMLLYNQFGFKAEEFVAGFYEDYLDPQSRASKNAFKLRLRR